jgi:PAS domain S-box-containing protein
VEFNAVTLYDNEGKPTGRDGIGRDITERKRTELALRESENRYRELFENMGSGVSVYETRNNGEDFIFKEYNTVAEMLDKTPRGQVIGRSVVDVFPGVKDFGLFDVFQRVYRTGKSERHPVTFYKDEKISRWRENYVYKLPSGEIVAVFEDITERKRAEEALRESEELLNATQHLTKFGGWVWNVEQQIMFWTNEVYRIHDFVPGEMMPGSAEHITRSSECYDPENRPVILAAFQRCVEEGQPYDFDFPFTTAKGRRLWVRTTAQPVIESGRVIRVIGNIMDITERKQVEEELRASHLQLRALATHLQQIREEERIMIAREIHDEMGGGLTGLKMDLSWLLHKMGDADPGEARVAWMDKIHAANVSIDRMIHLVRRISTDLRPSILDDLGLIAALEWQLSEFTSRTEIPHEFATTVEYVNMEEDTAVAVFRIFQEALTNVVRHARATKVAVVLREGERNLFGDESLVLEIRDNGRGIKEEEILNSESLGLLGMKERVLTFGGALSIRGEPGGGTALVLKIPRKQGEPS